MRLMYKLKVVNNDCGHILRKEEVLYLIIINYNTTVLRCIFTRQTEIEESYLFNHLRENTVIFNANNL